MKRNLIAAKIRAGIATPQELGTLRRDDLVAIKSDDEHPHYRWGHDVLIGRAGEGSLPEGQVEHVFSTDRRDAMGDRILVPGWDLSRTRGKALGVFWGHETREFPIGRVLRAWRGELPEGMKDAGDPEERDQAPSRLTRRALMGRSEFHPAEAYGETTFGEKAVAARALVERGLVRGGSVGFIPMKIHFPKSAEEREELDLGEWGVVFEEQELLEWSITPIPANPDATQTRTAARAFRTQTTAALIPLTRRGLISNGTAEDLIDWLGGDWERAITAGADRTVVAVRQAVDRIPRAYLAGLEEGPPQDPADETLEPDDEGSLEGSEQGEGEEETRSLGLPELLVSTGSETEIRLVLTDPPDDAGDFLERSWLYDPAAEEWVEDEPAVELEGLPIPTRYAALVARFLRECPTDRDGRGEEREALDALQEGTAVLLELCGRMVERFEEHPRRTRRTGGEGADGDGDEGLPETPDPGRSEDPEAFYAAALEATRSLRGRTTRRPHPTRANR